jgi:acyl-CoA synthetase (AMP-forming)/AMP-acid ligase II
MPCLAGCPCHQPNVFHFSCPKGKPNFRTVDSLLHLPEKVLKARSKGRAYPKAAIQRGVESGGVRYTSGTTGHSKGVVATN